LRFLGITHPELLLFDGEISCGERGGKLRRFKLRKYGGRVWNLKMRTTTLENWKWFVGNLVTRKIHFIANPASSGNAAKWNW
jgi:hypothetical protein